jgi:hypothetical protein
MKTKSVDVALTVVNASESIPGWWTIERAAHDGRVWLEPTEYGMALMTAGRISDADVEGSEEEMLAIAAAIEARGEFEAKRCAVKVADGRAEFWSPRNSMTIASVPLPAADELAAEIRAKVAAVSR